MADAAVRVDAHYYIWLVPAYLSHYLAAELSCILQLTVRIFKKHDLLDTHHCGGIPLLLLDYPRIVGTLAAMDWSSFVSAWNVARQNEPDAIERFGL